MRTICVIVFFVILNLTSGYADSIQINKTTNLKQGLNETEAYKMLYENQLKANESILNTIYYSLGGLGTAILLVFASNWWFNDKKVKDIIAEIDTRVKNLNGNFQNELNEKMNVLSIAKTEELYISQAKLQEEISNYILQTTSRVSELNEKIRDEIQLTFKEATAIFERQIQVSNDSLDERINTLSKSLNLSISSLKDLLNSKEDNIKTLITLENQAHAKDIDLIKTDIYRNAFYMWEARGVMSNALTYQIKELEIVGKRMSDLSFYLNHLFETCEKMKYMSKYDKESLRTALDKLPKKYEISEKILDLIEKLPES